MPTKKWTPKRKREYARQRYKRIKAQKSKVSGIRFKPSLSAKSYANSSNFVMDQYQDYWMDNAVENMYNLISKVHDANPSVVGCELQENKLSVNINDTKRFLQSMERLITSKRDSVLFSESSSVNKPKKNVKLGYILIQYAKSLHGRNAVKEKIYDENEMLARLSAGFVPNTGRKICVLCGSNFEKRIDYLKQSILPSVTRNAALSGTLRKDDYFRDICPTCYMLGALEWIDDRIMYRSQTDGESIALYPVASDLKMLEKEKRMITTHLGSRTLYSNLPVHSKDGRDLRIQGPYSALLHFLESVVQSLTRRTGYLFDQSPDLVYSFGKWTCLRVPSGNIKNVRIETIELPQRVLKIVRQVDDASVSEDKALRIYSDLFSYFALEFDRPTAGYRLWEEIGELKEDLAEYFIKDDFHAFSSLFLKRKGANVYLRHEKWYRLDSFLSAWQLDQIGIGVDALGKVKQTANLIAELNLSNISVFYNLERARSASEFISALQEASRKLVVRAEDFAGGEMQVNPMSLDSLLQLVTSNPAKWQVIRDTLLIYAAMYYAIKRRGSK